MEPISWHVHILNDLGGIEGRQLQSKSTRVFGLNTGFAPRLVVLPQAFVLERLNHERIVACCAPRNKLHFS
jgi:hypothetical protein